MSDYDTAYFKKINAEEGEQAERLANVLAWKYNPKSVLDIGCASGLYLKPFTDLGIKIHGVDYSEAAVDDSVLQVPRSVIEVADITKQSVKSRADLTMSVEVLEHIPAAGAETAIKHIAQTSKLIFFTAAQPGQGGVGHVNCQPKQYWQELFAKQGFKRDIQDENYIRTIMASGYHMGWLINNLMIFKKSK